MRGCHDFGDGVVVVVVVVLRGNVRLDWNRSTITIKEWWLKCFRSIGLGDSKPEGGVHLSAKLRVSSFHCRMDCFPVLGAGGVNWVIVTGSCGSQPVTDVSSDMSSGDEW